MLFCDLHSEILSCYLTDDVVVLEENILESLIVSLCVCAPRSHQTTLSVRDERWKMCATRKFGDFLLQHNSIHFNCFWHCQLIIIHDVEVVSSIEFLVFCATFVLFIFVKLFLCSPLVITCFRINHSNLMVFPSYA